MLILPVPIRNEHTEGHVKKEEQEHSNHRGSLLLVYTSVSFEVYQSGDSILYAYCIAYCIGLEGSVTVKWGWRGAREG